MQKVFSIFEESFPTFQEVEGNFLSWGFRGPHRVWFRGEKGKRWIKILFSQGSIWNKLHLKNFFGEDLEVFYYEGGSWYKLPFIERLKEKEGSIYVFPVVFSEGILFYTREYGEGEVECFYS